MVRFMLDVVYVTKAGFLFKFKLLPLVFEWPLVPQKVY